ncbi:hypothetical protein LPTSP4_25290 [Leptospira ryugenii]|uniref:Uncharacterized protein n=1 Tax=Leptospira ryugenii TaxID=1917863 RepID=A0A2P2E283_9LEPT|nr:hypothetical protein LPTSP4_25290 [Leptospira ryugenii]
MLFHYFANLDDGHSDTYLEIIHLLHFQNSSIDSYPLKSPFELQEKEMIAYRSQSNSGLAKVTTRSSEQIVLSIKGKKFHKLPQNGKMEAIVYRKGVGIQRFQGKSKKISHNHIAFIPTGQLG